jgi:hypothetical protein
VWDVEWTGLTGTELLHMGWRGRWMDGYLLGDVLEAALVSYYPGLLLSESHEGSMVCNRLFPHSQSLGWAEDCSIFPGSSKTRPGSTDSFNLMPWSYLLSCHWPKQVT